MARKSAINAVADAVLAALNVPSLRALCPGGVYRSLIPAQTPPYVIVGPCSEIPDDHMGFGYGSIVTVPVRVTQVAGDAVSEDRAIDIVDKALALLDEPASLTVTGWTVSQVNWTGTQQTAIETQDGSVPATSATLDIHVRQL